MPTYTQFNNEELREELIKLDHALGKDQVSQQLITRFAAKRCLHPLIGHFAPKN